MPDSTADLPSRLADSLTATTVWQQELIAKLLERGNAEVESGLDVALIIHDLHAQVETLKNACTWRTWKPAHVKPTNPT